MSKFNKEFQAKDTTTGRYTKCVVCHMPIDVTTNWNLIKDNYKELLNRVDFYGPDSLTEEQQTIYMNCVHFDCIEELK